MNIIKALTKNNLFLDMTEQEINTVFDCLEAKLVKYQKGRQIAISGTVFDSLGIVIDGYLAKFVIDNNGERRPIAVISLGDMFNSIEIFCPSPIMYNVATIEDCTILYINPMAIAASNQPKLITNTMSYLAKEVAALEKNRTYITLKSMRPKIARLIFEMYQKQNSLSILMPFNRNTMADYLSVSRPSMSREMIKMREEGIITFHKETIEIVDLEKLKLQM